MFKIIYSTSKSWCLNIPKSSFSSKVTNITDSVPKPTHIPVLLSEVIDKLAIKDKGLYLDATFGYGGYTKAILDACPTARVVALDQDPLAYSRAHQLSQMKEYNGRIIPLLGKYGNLPQHLHDLKQRLTTIGSIYNKNSELEWDLDSFDGLVLDVGVSSGQLDDVSRGFSYIHDGTLDMRMCHFGKETLPEELASLPEVDWSAHRQLYTSRTLTAHQIVNNFTVAQLADIIYKYGEEHFSKRIAQAIGEARNKSPIETTSQLSEIILKVSPRHTRPNPHWGRLTSSTPHPAARTFQSLRIFINDELKELEKVLEASAGILKSDGTLAVVSFHSLEDRIVKRFLINNSASKTKSSGSRKPHLDVQAMKNLRQRRHKEKMKMLVSGPDSYDANHEAEYGNYEMECSGTEMEHDILAPEDDVLDDCVSQPKYVLPFPRSSWLVLPTKEEFDNNPRCRSAKLRWAYKI